MEAEQRKTRIETDTLVLRSVRPADTAALHAHWTDPIVRRFLWDDEHIPVTQVASLVEESAMRFRKHQHGLWAICLREDAGLQGAQFIGCGGFWPFHDPPRLELLLSLSPAWHGRGLATQAGSALLTYARDVIGMTEVLASTDAPNEASRRLLERLEFVFTHRAEMEGLDTLFYARSLSQ
ncbi:MAG: GNAT family protein [Bacteroidota bacterium]